MVAIRDWLLDYAKQELFSFDKADFDQESNEILEGYVESDDQGAEAAYRNDCWRKLHAIQQDREYLASLNLHRIIARHVRNSCRKARTSPSIASWVELGLSETSKLDGPELASEIENAIRDAWKVRPPWTSDAVPKFSEKLLFESIDKFHLGLENIIGYPPTNSDFLDQMKREHEQGEPFADQKGRNVDPKIEWNIVMRSEAWNITGAECEPSFEIEKREIGKPLEIYFQQAKAMFSDTSTFKFGAKNQSLIEAEVAALRLWTGPMHKKYAEVLRNPKKPSVQYVTTLHALNSGITKLARVWRLPSNRKVYRGYRNLSLKEIKKDEFHCVGGVEKSVLATSEDFNIAVQYSGDGAFILEMDVGQVNRGADVSWLSQFPHEQEILFNALSNIEFVCSPQLRFVEGRGTILVYQVCVSANVKSKTLEEFVSLRKDLHLNLVDVLTQEVRRMIYMREADSRYGLIKSLCAECRNQCDRIVEEAGKADVHIFNDGAPTYLTLVEGAILLRSRAVEIIDLTLCWFETKQADPSKLDLLQDWQLEAVRSAFRSGEGPEVLGIVLEQFRVISSLFTAESLDLGAIHKPETVCRVAKLLTLNPNLDSLKMEIASGTAEVWELVFKQLCPGRPRLRVNDFFLAEYAAVNTLRQLELRNLDIQMAAMIAPALQFHAPSALTALSLRGSPIGCSGAESLGRAVGNLQRLRYVDLRSCEIADRGCTGISHGLPALSELEDLNLAHNHVKDDGFNVLASAIPTSGPSRLKSVDMRWNDTQLPSLLCEPRCIVRNHIVSKLSTDSKVNCVTWSPGGYQIASGSMDKNVIIWDANTGERVWTLKGHTNWVQSVAWRPGGDQLVSGGYGSGDAEYPYDNPGEIIIWDAKSRDQVAVLKGHTKGVTSVSWRPGGDQIASGSWDNTIIIWDAKTGEQISTLKGHTKWVTSVAWRPGSPGHPGGDQIASGSGDNTINIWDAKTGEQVSTLKGHTNGVQSVAWRPGGDQIVSGGYGDRFGDKPGKIIIWDARTGEQVSKLKGHTMGVTSVAWRPGGDQIASASDDRTIIIWDAKTGEQVSTLEGHTGDVTSVAWRPGSPGHPGGDQIVSGCSDQVFRGSENEIIIWDAKTGDQISTLKGHTADVMSVAWRPGGDQIASGSWDKTIIIWDAKTGEQVSTLKGHTEAVMSVAWRPGGDQIASASWDKTIIIWDAKTGEQISTLKGHTSAVTSVAWRPGSPGHPGGDQIASGSGDDTIIIWDAKTGEQVSTLKGHTNTVTSVAWRPGGDQIASASRDKTIIIWDAKTGEQISTLKGHTEAVMSVAWRPGSPGHPGGDQIASGSRDNTVIIWDTKTGEQISTLKGHTSDVMSVAWRPGGDQIASASDVKTIIIWDAKTGEKVSTLKGHTSYVNSVAWRPGGDLIASGSDDGTIIIWDANTGDQISTLKGHTAKVMIVAWCPGGDQIASGSLDNTITIWDAKTGEQVSTLKGHSGSVYSAACRPGGDQIASGSADNNNHLVKTGDQGSTLKGTDGQCSVSQSAPGPKRKRPWVEEER